jgi:hypothetical protein
LYTSAIAWVSFNHSLLVKRKMKMPKGTSLAVILLSLLCVAIYGAIAIGLASQIGKAPGVIQGVTADD